MNSTSADALFTSSTSAVGTRGAGARANAWLDIASAAVKTAAPRARFVIRRSPSRVPCGGSSMAGRECHPAARLHSTPGVLVITEDGERMAAGPVICALELGPQVLCPETSLTLLSLPESGSSAHA